MTPFAMASVEKLVTQLERDPANVRFSELHRICVHFFGDPRQGGSSHAVFKMPWPGDPRVNIQNDKGKAKPYQVRQVLAAIAKLQGKTK
jgi:hypothetical protein